MTPKEKALRFRAAALRVDDLYSFIDNIEQDGLSEADINDIDFSLVCLSKIQIALEEIAKKLHRKD